MYAVMPSPSLSVSLSLLPYCQVKPTAERPALQPCKRLFASFRCLNVHYTLFSGLGPLSFTFLVFDGYIYENASQQVSPFRGGRGRTGHGGSGYQRLLCG